MKLRLDGFDRVAGRMDAILLLHIAEGILYDLSEGLSTLVVKRPEGVESPNDKIDDARKKLNGLLSDLLDGRVTVE